MAKFLYNPSDRVNRALDALKKDYTLIGKRHIKGWHVWLILGIIGGAIGAVALVVNRSGTFDAGRAAELNVLQNGAGKIPIDQLMRDGFDNASRNGVLRTISYGANDQAFLFETDPGQPPKSRRVRA